MEKELKISKSYKNVDEMFVDLLNEQIEEEHFRYDQHGSPKYIYTWPMAAVTADVVVCRRDQGIQKILVIKRGKEPFLGMYALPGGHISPGEDTLDAARRELHEETGLMVDADKFILVGVFSKAGRDPRGWYVTTAYAVELEDEYLGDMKAGDDADSFEWVPIDQPLAFDHDKIVEEALALINKGWNLKWNITRGEKYNHHDHLESYSDVTKTAYKIKRSDPQWMLCVDESPNDSYSWLDTIQQCMVQAEQIEKEKRKK